MLLMLLLVRSTVTLTSTDILTLRFLQVTGRVICLWTLLVMCMVLFGLFIDGRMMRNLLFLSCVIGLLVWTVDWSCCMALMSMVLLVVRLRALPILPNRLRL